jgi:hypothetical protein
MPVFLVVGPILLGITCTLRRALGSVKIAFEQGFLNLKILYHRLKDVSFLVSGLKPSLKI